MSLISSMVLNRAVDPSQTTTLRTAMAKALKTRFRRFRAAIVKAIVDDDIFGITLRFFDPAQGASEFMKFIDQKIHEHILETYQMSTAGRSVDAAWTNQYIQDAYKRGIHKARTQMHGFAPSLKVTGGIDTAMTTLAHTNGRSLLFMRVFNELKGVTDAMSQQIARVVSQGISSNLRPRELANQITQVIIGTGSVITTNAPGMTAQDRAELIARTEIIRAYAEAQLTEFETWGVHGVNVQAELLTAGDERVCPRCNALAKHLFTIEEARGVIPIHPRCRCVWVPYLKN